MASLSNINGLFDVHSTGAILFSTSHGTSGQILRSNGNAAPTWVAASTVIGGPYLPLTGGTLSGPLAGTSATFAGNLSANAYLMSNGSLTNGGFWGATLNAGTGSHADFALLDSGTTRIMHVPTGTRNVVFESNVGIGTDDPDNELHIAKAGTPVINLERVDDLLGAGNVISVLRSTSLTNKIISQISTECDLNYTSKGRLMFYTNDGTNAVERMRIASGGDIELKPSTSRIKGGGTTSGKLELLNSDSTSYIVVNGSANAAAHEIAFVTNSALAAKITAAGEISFNSKLQQNAHSTVLSNSAYNNAAAVQAYASNTANVYPGYGFHKASVLGSFLYATSRTELRLRGDGGTDKVLLMADSGYEEGTFTPTLRFNSNTTGITYAGNAGTVYRGGHYTKVGRVVTFSLRIILTSKGSASGQAEIVGLPYDAASLPGNYGSAMYSFANNFLVPERATITIDSSSSIIRLRFVNSPNGNYGNVTNSGFNNNSDIILTGTYLAN